MIAMSRMDELLYLALSQLKDKNKVRVIMEEVQKTDKQRSREKEKAFDYKKCG